MIPARNSAARYGWVSIALHWGMAIAIFAMFGLGLWMRSLGYYDRWYHDAPELHKAAGMLLLLALILRLAWRLTNARPQLMGAAWEQTVALQVQRLHYLLLFALSITGYLIPTAEGAGIDIFGWGSVPALITLDAKGAEFAGTAHRYLAWGAIALAVAHSTAALKHHLINRDATLRRMLGLPP